MIFNFLLHYHVVEMNDLLNNAPLLVRIRELTLHEYSGMNIALNTYQNEAKLRTINAKAVIAYYARNPIGWALVTMESDHNDFFPRTEDEAGVQVFVEPPYRRHKIGTRLLKEAKANCPRQIIKVYADDNPPFFKTFLEEGSFKPVY